MSTPIFNRGDFQHPTDGWYHIEAKGNHPNAKAGVTQVIDDAACASIVNRFNAEAAKPGFPGMLIDHEHFKHDDDKETVAYGWLSQLQNRGDGIYAQIRWTGTGKKAVDDGDYRFFSTEYDPSDLETISNKKPKQVRPLALAGLTLTNVNNNKGQKPITNRMKKTSVTLTDEQVEQVLNGGPGSGPRPGGGSAAGDAYQEKAASARSASISANSASQKANESDDLNDRHEALKAHREAESAHLDAAAAAKNAGDKNSEKIHKAIAAQHSCEADKQFGHFKNREFPSASGDTDRPQPQTQIEMKSVIKHLGLAENADENAVLDAVKKITNRVTELEGQVVEADLETYKNRFDPKQKDFIKTGLVTNRASTIEFLKAQPERKEEKAPARIHNRNAAEVPSGNPLNGDGEAERASKISDEIAKERQANPKASYEQARNRVRNRMPQLFGLPARNGN